MDFRFRALDVDDLVSYVDIFEELTFKFPIGTLITAEEFRSFPDRKIPEMLASGTRYGLFQKGALIGFGGMHGGAVSRVAHFCELGPFFVRAEYHGTGAAKVLMDGFVDEARRQGRDFIKLFVDQKNPRAIGFYEKYGFVKVGEVFDEVRIDGVSRTDWVYRYYLV